MEEKQVIWSLYLIRTNNGSLYTGITTDVSRRFLEHQSGGLKAAKSLKGKGPLLLEFQIEVGDHSSALKLEYKVKKLHKNKKEQLLKSSELLTDLFPDLFNSPVVSIKTDL
jgi:putative endonuclease